MHLHVLHMVVLTAERRVTAVAAVVDLVALLAPRTSRSALSTMLGSSPPISTCRRDRAALGMMVTIDDGTACTRTFKPKSSTWLPTRVSNF